LPGEQAVLVKPGLFRLLFRPQDLETIGACFANSHPWIYGRETGSPNKPTPRKLHSTPIESAEI
jgi:hypothetical protein